MSLGAGNLLLASAGDAGYNLTRSLRFRASASAYLNRTPASVGNRQTFTISAWVKRGTLAATQYLFGTYLSTGVDEFNFNFNSADTLWIGDYQSADNILLKTTQVFRDPSAWYHLVLAIDTTQATAANRVKLYVNGSQVTAFSTATYPSQNYNTTVWNTSSPSAVGARGRVYTNNLDGYLTEYNFIDGQALTPSSFGSYDALTGVWQPARYTGTYGTNGFYLPFTDNSALTTSSNVGLGKDFSGNGNYWTTNNISITAGVTYDSMTDVPTLTSATAANFAVLNPLNPSRSTLTNGNLTASGTTDTPTIIPTSGTYYFEIDGVSKSWTPPAAFPAAAGNYNFGQRPFTNTPTGTLLNTFNLPTSTIVKGDTAMNIALAAGASIKASTEALFSGQFLEWIKDRANVNNHQLLDGVRGLSAVLQSNTTAAETTYTAPSGNSVGFAWKAGSSSSSNTNGTIASTVSVNASAGFSIAAFTTPSGYSNGTVGHGLGVTPALVIVKNRSGSPINWNTYHQSLGNGSALYLSGTQAALVNAAYWNNTSPTSSVFSVGSNLYPSADHVAYCWTPIAGYSAFGSLTGNGSTDGVFVYLGFKPRFILYKRTDSTSDWRIWDTARSPYNAMSLVLYPNASDAEASAQDFDALSNGFKIRNSAASMNASGGTYIYAAFASNPFRNSLAQ